MPSNVCPQLLFALSYCSPPATVCPQLTLKQVVFIPAGGDEMSAFPFSGKVSYEAIRAFVANAADLEEEDEVPIPEIKDQVS